MLDYNTSLLVAQDKNKKGARQMPRPFLCYDLVVVVVVLAAAAGLGLFLLLNHQ